MDTNIINKILQARYGHGTDCRSKQSECKSALSSQSVCLIQTSLCVIITRGLLQKEKPKIISRCGVSGNAVEPRTLYL